MAQPNERRIYLLDEFLTVIKAAKPALKEWENHGLIRPAGYTDDKKPYYTDGAVRRAAHIQKLLGVGYGINEIQWIIAKVGLPEAATPTKPSRQGSTRLLTVGQLARASKLSPRTLKHWEEKGILEPNMRSSGGFRLYAEHYVTICRLIQDLQLFGYSLEEIKTISDYFRDFLALSADVSVYSRSKVASRLDEMLKAIEQLYVKMNQLEAGILRWHSFLKQKRNEIQTLVQQNQKRSAK